MGFNPSIFKVVSSADSLLGSENGTINYCERGFVPNWCLSTVHLFRRICTDGNMRLLPMQYEFYCNHKTSLNVFVSKVESFVSKCINLFLWYDIFLFNGRLPCHSVVAGLSCDITRYQRKFIVRYLLK
jgi:hypothetical protein